MSNSHGRHRTGFPPPRPAQGDERAYDPHRQPDEPSLSWPPRAAQPQQQNQHSQQPSYPDPEWGYDQPGAGDPQYGGLQNDQEWAQPQQGFAPVQQGYPQGNYQDPYARPAGGHSQQAPSPYAEDPFAAQHRPHEPRGFGGQPAPNPQNSPYAAQFETYVPPSVAPEPTTGRPMQGGGYGVPQTEPPLQGSSYEDDWPVTQPSQGGYARSDTGYYQQPDYSAEQGYMPEPQAYPGDQWGGPQQGAADAGYSATAYAADPYAYQGEAAYHGDPYGQQLDPSLAAGPQSVSVNDEYDDYDEEYEEEEVSASGRKRLLTVVGALVGAIVVGAGLAYGYKAFVVGGTKISSVPPVVRGDAAANKARPKDPGGRTFEHTDSKVMRRISSGGRASTNADGTRRVATMMIGRDGSVVDSGAASLPSATPPEEPAVSVPGLTVVDGFAGQRAARRAAAEQRKTGGGPIVVKPPTTSENALSPVRPVSVTEPPKAVAPPVRAPEKVVAAVSPPKVSAPVVTAKPRPLATTKTAPSSGGKGYVAVLASVPVSATSRLEALKTFADIQQNYGSVLQNRTPDVREANLGSKGTYHRLMVGPPSSREAASTLCKQLKSAGYPSCWITAY